MSSSQIDKELNEVANMFDSIGDYRNIVVAATLDEMDRKPSDEVDNDVPLSLADTERVSNIHPYLVRYADKYAHKMEFSDPAELNSPSCNTKFIKISRPARQREFKKGEMVMYHDEDTNASYEATIINIHYDDMGRPQYDLMFKGGSNEGDEDKEDNLRLSVKDDSIKQQPQETLENFPKNADEPDETVECVDFDVNPTQLFRAIYDGDWETALKRLQSNPEEASVWVARYNTQSDEKKIFRWRLLPLHLCIALNGNNDDDDVIAQDQTDAPDDEKEGKEDEKQPPPRTLLAAILRAYPQGTQCADDHNLVPLHSAIRGNTSIAFLEELMKSDPASIHCKDARGRNAFMLVEKVFGKRSAETNGKRKYERLKTLLNLFASHPDAKLKEQQQHYDARLNELEHENLSLRQNNDLLRTHCERNNDLLEKLVAKLQEYQEIIGSDSTKAKKDGHGNLTSLLQDKEQFPYARMDSIHSIPPPPPSTLPDTKHDNVAENWKVAFDTKSCKEYYFNKMTRVVSWVKPNCLEEIEEETVGNLTDDIIGEEVKNKIIGGNGAYAKRLERHIQTSMTYDEADDVPVTPMSGSTGLTEAVTPETWEGKNLELELESFNDEDKANNPFMADLNDASSEDIVEGIFRLKPQVNEEERSLDSGNRAVSFTDARAFTYSDIVKVGDAENECSEIAQEQAKPRVTFKDIPPASEKKEKRANSAVSAEMERLRQKFSDED